MSQFDRFDLSQAEQVADAVVDLLRWDRTIVEWATVGGRQQVVRGLDREIVPDWPVPLVVVVPALVDSEPQPGHEERRVTIEVSFVYDERREYAETGETTAASLIEHYLGLVRAHPRLDHRQGPPYAQQLQTVQRLGLVPVYFSDDRVEAAHVVATTYLLEAA